MYMLQAKTEEFVYKPIHPSMERKTQKELSIKEFTILQEDGLPASVSSAWDR